MEKEGAVHIHNGLWANHKKQWNNSIYSNMDRPRDWHTELSQTKTDTICYHLYVEAKQQQQQQKQ